MAKSSSSAMTSNASEGVGKTSVIAQGTSIQGNFKSTENLRIDGKLHGDIQCDKKLVVGTQGEINGTIKAAEIYIEGKVVGDINSLGAVVLGSTANVEGKLHASTIQVDEGAIMNGELNIARN